MPENEKKKGGKGWLIVLVVIVGLIWIAASQDTTTPTKTPTTNTTTSKTSTASKTTTSSKKGLELVESSSERNEYGNLFITGTIKNHSNKTYIYVQVTFNLYDDSGAQVGTTMANTNNLEAGGTWKFKALVSEDNATKYKFTGIDAF